MYAYTPPSHLSHILNAMLIVSYVSSFFLLYLNLYLLTGYHNLQLKVKQNPTIASCLATMLRLEYIFAVFAK